MGLKKQSGNMYSFVTHTWNPIKGRCAHGCDYCYMLEIWKRMKDATLRLDEKELKTNLGSGNFIFIGSGTDMWANNVPGEWLAEVMGVCYQYPDNTYLFQSKNPARFVTANSWFPDNMILGTTIESNRVYHQSSPMPFKRVVEMEKLANAGFKTMVTIESNRVYHQSSPMPFERVVEMEKLANAGFKTMLTIEPIMDFCTKILIKYIKMCQPLWVNIGADSKGHNLPEPSSEKIQLLIYALKIFTEVKLKKNLKRLMV